MKRVKNPRIDRFWKETTDGIETDVAKMLIPIIESAVRRGYAAGWRAAEKFAEEEKQKSEHTDSMPPK